LSTIPPRSTTRTITFHLIDHAKGYVIWWTIQKHWQHWAHTTQNETTRTLGAREA